MKIAIAGLLAGQARKMEVEFPTLKLQIVTQEKMSQIAAITRSAQEVLVMTKFISHKDFGNIDRRKVFNCPGGLTQLRARLATHAAMAPVPTPSSARSYHTKEPDMSTVKTSFTSLNTVVVGDVLVFKRPARMTISHFESTVRASRSYYKTHHGVSSEQATKDGTIEVLITEVARWKGKTSGKKLPKMAEPEYPDAAPGAETPTTSYVGPTPGHMLAEFWQQVYLQVLRNQPGSMAQQCVDHANVALAAFNQRFK